MKNIDFSALEDSDYDRLMGQGSGAGVIFGNTGGVMEAALRTAYEYITGDKAPAVLYQLEPVRGMEAVKEASLQVGGMTVNVAVVYGTASLRRFLDKRDGAMKVRLSHENEEIKALYSEFYGKPLSGLAEKMLHTCYRDRSGQLNGEGMD